MKIIVLIENTSQNELLCEHGLSFYIEYKGYTYLLDAGSTSAFMRNASSLNIDIDEADYCILSHGHYDHSDGFKDYLLKNNDQMIYSTKQVFKDYYSSSNHHLHYIGVCQKLKELSKNFIFINQPLMLIEDVYLLPNNGIKNTVNKGNLYVLEDGEYKDDVFEHELSLVFDTDKGLVVLNSCSHAGIVNIIKNVKKHFPDKLIYAYIGGLHMKGKVNNKEICTYSDEELKEISEYLLYEDIHVYTGHCTGSIAYDKLKDLLGSHIDLLYTGKCIDLEDL